MPCHHCQSARKELAQTLRSISSGNLQQAAQSAKTASQHIADKAMESERIRRMLGKR